MDVHLGGSKWLRIGFAPKLGNVRPITVSKCETVIRPFQEYETVIGRTFPNLGANPMRSHFDPPKWTSIGSGVDVENHVSLRS